MDNINEMIVQNFNENIEYLQQDHPELFQKLSAFDTAVANGHYKEKYELVYENGNFDVLETASQTYLYNKNTSLHTQQSLQNTNNQLDNNLFECFTRASYSKEEIQNYKSNETLDSHQNFTAELVAFSNTMTYNETGCSIEKYIFFGTGTGVHIAPIIQKLSPSYILIIEDDLELFRLSLFCTNYAQLAKERELLFSVFEDADEFNATTEIFLNTKYYLNHYIKYFELLSHSREKNNLFYLALTNQPHLRFLFNDLLLTYTRPLEYMVQQYAIVQNSLKLSTYPTLPFLLLASGPSLEKHIKWVQKNQENYTIVAVSSALKFLLDNNVKIDIVTHLDPFEASKHSFDRLPSLTPLENTLKLFSVNTPPSIMKLFHKNDIFLFETGTSYGENSLKISSPCIGSWSLLMLLAIEAKEIYLLGLDLALDSQTGKNHMSEHQTQYALDLTGNDMQDGTLKYKDSAMKIAGNLQTEVYTTPHFYASVAIINKYFPQVKKSFQKVYNLSDGAYFNIAEPVVTSDLEHKTNAATACDLKKILTQYSTHSFSNAVVQKKLLHAKKLHTEIASFHYEQSLSAEEYISNIIQIIASEKMTRYFELSRALEDCLKFTAHYIFYALSHSKTKAMNPALDTIFRSNILKLIDYYSNTLEKFQKGNEYNELH
jgi:hypothetical protein